MGGKAEVNWRGRSLLRLPEPRSVYRLYALRLRGAPLSGLLILRVCISTPLARTEIYHKTELRESPSNLRTGSERQPAPGPDRPRYRFEETRMAINKPIQNFKGV